jgi:hypothetical protein
MMPLWTNAQKNKDTLAWRIQVRRNIAAPKCNLCLASGRMSSNMPCNWHDFPRNPVGFTQQYIITHNLKFTIRSCFRLQNLNRGIVWAMTVCEIIQTHDHPWSHPHRLDLELSVVNRVHGACTEQIGMSKTCPSGAKFKHSGLWLECRIDSKR